jgi:LCP family protein required for cell wall assembly
VRAGRIVGVAVYVLACGLSLVVVVYGGLVYVGLRSIGSSNAIGANAPKSKDGAVNILLIGLDSRKDQNGNDLPQAVIDQLHAGSKDGIDNQGVGGYNTNTLILMHVPNDGSRATAFSIPRDDYVTYVSAIGPQQQGKIKEAYGVTKASREDALYAQGVHDHVQLEHLGREAARTATIDTVRNLLGVPIDHFAEINLGGFYDLATALGGVDVCLKHAVSDTYSGANFHAGIQHLNGAQSLAFVRQRHGLTNGDLDRTRRQQAFLASITHKLKQEGLFSDLGKMQGLLGVAKKDIVLDKAFDVLSFAQQAQGLTGGNEQFYTLPIKGFATINSQSVNLIDPAAIKALVQGAIGPRTTGPSGPSGTATVDVYNGSGTKGLAARVVTALTAHGYPAGATGNTHGRPRTIVRYGSGSDADATRVAHLFGATAVSDTSVAAGHVEVDLGRDGHLPVFTAAPPVKQSSGAQGGAVGGGGIPCVD